MAETEIHLVGGSSVTVEHPPNQVQELLTGSEPWRNFNVQDQDAVAVRPDQVTHLVPVPEYSGGVSWG